MRTRKKTYLQIQHRNHSEDRSCFVFLFKFSLWILFITRGWFCCCCFPLVSKKRMLVYDFGWSCLVKYLMNSWNNRKTKQLGFIKTPPWDQVGDISKIIGSCCESCHEISEAKVEIFRKSIWMKYFLEMGDAKNSESHLWRGPPAVNTHKLSRTSRLAQHYYIHPAGGLLGYLPLSSYL